MPLDFFANCLKGVICWIRCVDAVDSYRNHSCEVVYKLFFYVYRYKEKLERLKALKDEKENLQQGYVTL